VDGGMDLGCLVVEQFRLINNEIINKNIRVELTCFRGILVIRKFS